LWELHPYGGSKQNENNELEGKETVGKKKKRVGRTHN